MEDFVLDSSDRVWVEFEVSHQQWEARRLYTPVWMGKWHGFHDQAEWETDDFIRILDEHLPREIESWDWKNNAYHFQCVEVEVVIEVSLNAHCFILPPKVFNKAYVLSRTQIDPLRNHLRVVAEHEGRQLESFSDLAMAVLRILETACASLNELREPQTMVIGKPPNLLPELITMDNQEIETESSDPSQVIYTNLSSINLTSQCLFGLTISQICQNIPETWKVLHVESVLRSDLVNRFVNRRESLHIALRRSRLSDNELKRLNPLGSKETRLGHASREDIIRDLVRPKITFHGTPRHNVASIVRYGFKLPGATIGDGVVCSPRSGIAFAGRGIYSSPQPYYAVSYASRHGTATTAQERPGLRLFVCATLMGRTYRGHDVHSGLWVRFDANATSCGLEYIVYDPAQILPCYVIHLDLNTDAAVRTIEAVQLNPSAYMEQQAREAFRRRRAKNDLAPGDLQRLKEAKKAAAAKWFPYGFGPAKGCSFVIEEIGEVSDDEENYGDFQAARHEAWKFLEDDDNDTNDGIHLQEGARRAEYKKYHAARDEYTEARNSNAQIRYQNVGP